MTFDAVKNQNDAIQKNVNYHLWVALDELNKLVKIKTGESYSYAFEDLKNAPKLSELITHRLTLLADKPIVNLSDYAFHFEHSGAFEGESHEEEKSAYDQNVPDRELSHEAYLTRMELRAKTQ